MNNLLSLCLCLSLSLSLSLSLWLSLSVCLSVSQSFQSDPLEKRFDQYRQMSGSRFLVGLKDINCSDKNLKIKSFLKEDIDIDEEIKISYRGEMEIMKLKPDIDYLGILMETLMFFAW